MARNKRDQVMLPLKLLSPENMHIGFGRAYRFARRQYPQVRHRRAPAGTPGSEGISSQRLGLRGNKGGPRHFCRCYRQCFQPSLTRKAGRLVAWKSGLPIRATRPGNAGGAKGQRFETLLLESMGRAPNRSNP